VVGYLTCWITSKKVTCGSLERVLKAQSVLNRALQSRLIRIERMDHAPFSIAECKSTNVDFTAGAVDKSPITVQQLAIHFTPESPGPVKGEIIVNADIPNLQPIKIAITGFAADA
jgi:hypothetical protein